MSRGVYIVQSAETWDDWIQDPILAVPNCIIA